MLYRDLSPANAGSARINDKEREKEERQVRSAKKMKGIEALRVKPTTLSQGIDGLIG